MEINDQIISLITSKLEGTASADELQQLQQWLDAASGNRQEYDELVKIWETSKDVLQSPTFNSRTAWNRLHATIADRQKNVRRTPVIALSTRKWLAIAAAVLITVVAGWYSWNTWRSRPQLVAATGNNQTVQLPDGSVVLLRKGSTLKYPAVFDAHERAVQLTGEAFFQVQRNKWQPFRITTAHSKVTVLGTSFLVDASKTGDKVVVVTGTVRVAGTAASQKEVVLTAGQEVLVSPGNLQQNQVIDSNFLAWKTGMLDFKEAPLPKVLKDIENYYETPIRTARDGQQSSLEQIHLNLHFKNQSLEQVLDEIKLATGLSVKKEGDTLIFYKK